MARRSGPSRPGSRRPGASRGRSGARQKVSGRRTEAPDSETTVDKVGERVQKVLAERGLGSRRELEEWIRAGRVTISGQTATLGDRAKTGERIEVDGRVVRRGAEMVPRVLLLNKAEGVVCTRRDPQGRPTCFDALPRLGSGRWISIGRLDAATTGLLLITNDGELAHRMMHPSTGLDREYAVRVDRRLDAEMDKALREGVLLDDGVARFSDIRYYDGTERNHWYHVTLMEGRNREVRRLFESQGVRVSRLKRVRFGPVVLPSGLRRGRATELTNEDLKALYRALSLPAPRLVQQRRRSGSRSSRPKSALIAYPALPSKASKEKPKE